MGVWMRDSGSRILDLTLRAQDVGLGMAGGLNSQVCFRIQSFTCHHPHSPGFNLAIVPEKTQMSCSCSWTMIIWRLFQHYNDIWTSGEFPTNWKEAIVVSIYKGNGTDTDTANYRPISLLNTIYKLFASMLQARLAREQDNYLRDTQFGFRAKKGTKHPLLILRRAMEWSETTGQTMHHIFLDWKRAFDSIDHNAMLIALGIFGISPRALSTIKGIYHNPTFEKASTMGEKVEGTVGSGIRQGCPLSPYLSIMVLTVIFEDVDDALLAQGQPVNTWSVARPTYDLEYADDTLLLALTATQLQRILTELESQAKNYGMHLNLTKTEILVDSRRARPAISFEDGSAVSTTTQVEYLRSMISWIKPFEAAFKHKPALAESGYKKLRLVWNSNLPRKTKMRIFQGTFLPVLIYGLHTLTLTDKQINRIDAYYLKFLRRIVNIEASFYSRISNHVVWGTARYPKKPSYFLLNAQYNIVSEVFHTDSSLPLHHVVFNSAYRDRIVDRGRRRGRKKPYFIETTSQRYFPRIWSESPGRGVFGPHAVHSAISRHLKRTSGHAPKRARRQRTRH